MPSFRDSKLKAHNRNPRSAICNLKFLVSALCLVTLLACARVPVTGRRTLNLISESQINQTSFQQYGNFLKEHQVVTGTAESRMVADVGGRIQKAVEKYMLENNLQDKIAGYEWEYNLVADEQVNAFCMPGGKVVFYQGIMPVCQDENGVAVVMGHEVAHAIAEHGNERMSQGLIVQFGGAALSQALAEKPQQAQQLAMAAFGAGTSVGVLLPYSRLHESEADHLGLIFMAMAGYNPEGAVAFWKRMAQKSEG
ncbi:M48 family metallopeptidase, partial [bacterium]|nr:M48 family metallopeptidase [bacterium]